MIELLPLIAAVVLACALLRLGYELGVSDTEADPDYKRWYDGWDASKRPAIRDGD